MKHYNSKYINPKALSDQDSYWVYNGLDGMLTHEVAAHLQKELSATNYAPNIYRHERSLLAPVMTMMRRGILVDPQARKEAVEGPGGLDERIAKVQFTLDTFTNVVWGKPLNVNSHIQLKKFFFEELSIPVITSSKKGEVKVSLDRDALEKIAKNYVRGMPFANLVLRLRDLQKQRDVLTKGLDDDGRWRCSFNIGGTETGRFSSSASPFRTGSNLQNIDPALRFIFVPDPGYRLCYLDLQGAEARAVAYLSGDEAYIQAVESADCHTLVAAMVFGIPEDRSKAEEKFYRDFSYRDMAKRGAHGCLTGDHEVLTPTGWQQISYVPDGTPIMAWNFVTEEAQWEIPSNWIRKLWQGPLVSLEGREYSMLATPDHRMPHINAKKTKFVRPACLTQKHGEERLPLTCKYNGGNILVQEDIARLHAAFQADGCLLGKNTVQFSFSRKRKILRLKQLLGTRHYTSNVNARGETWFRIPNADFIFNGKYAGPYLLGWNKEALFYFADELKHWDGTIQKKFTWIYGVNREHMFWLHTALRLSGIGSSYNQNQGHTCARVSESNRKQARISSMQINMFQGAPTMVYCPTVSSGGFIVRRNDCLMLSLNSNYYGTPRTMATHLKVATTLMESFQSAYFRRFPGIRLWHEAVAQQLQSDGWIETPFGRRRYFWSRLRDDSTLREAIAFVPQSLIADTLNAGLLRVWENLEPQLQLFSQVHDAIVIQIPDNKDGEAMLQEAMQLLRVEQDVTDIHGITRKMIIPVDAEWGMNWGKKSKNNPNGLVKYRP